eukprot:6200915-Pleurochrysis_carterae.AAC.1
MAVRPCIHHAMNSMNGTCSPRPLIPNLAYDGICRICKATSCATARKKVSCTICRLPMLSIRRPSHIGSFHCQFEPSWETSATNNVR